MFNNFRNIGNFDLKSKFRKFINKNIQLLGLTSKRTCDIVLAFAGIVLALPLFMAIALLVALDGGPVFYSHQRIGKNGRSFGCLKFRTMILGAQECLEEYLSYNPDERQEWEHHQKLMFDPRTTAVGLFLRKSSLDELPQLFNVLVGDMSFVGPRPVTQAELSHFYGRKARFYTSIRPGITGPWQISGRNEIGYSQRVMLDTRYALRHSFLNDLVILIRTPAAILSGRGAR